MKLSKISFSAAFLLGIFALSNLGVAHAQSSKPVKRELVYVYEYDNRSYGNIDILDFYAKARTIRVEIPNLALYSNERYKLICEEQQDPRIADGAYRKPDVRIQYKEQPKFETTNILLEVIDAKPSTDYVCQVMVEINDTDGRRYNNQYSNGIDVRTLKEPYRNHMSYKDGRRYNYANRLPNGRMNLNRYVYPRPDIVALRPRANWNSFGWGPKYYLAKFFQ